MGLRGGGRWWGEGKEEGGDVGGLREGMFGMENGGCAFRKARKRLA